MNAGMVIIVLVLVFVIILQIAKAAELAGIIRGGDSARESSKLHASLALGFLILGLAGMVWSLVHFAPRFLGPALSEHGPVIDQQFNITLTLTGIVFIICQIALFWFSYRYREGEGRKAKYYPDNNKLEIAWTIIPAIAMTFLVVKGMASWYSITGPEPAESVSIEVTGKQFGWTIRYPGRDGVFGAKGPLTLIKEDPNNILGLDWNDPASRDDIIIPNKLIVPADKPVHARLRSLDVLHSFFLPQLRVKMDVVPGTPTRFWFTATETTEDMIQKEGPGFKYIFTCAELCGDSHYSMAAAMDVITADSFATWAATEVPYYERVYGSTSTGKSLEDETSLAQNNQQ
jgi:cytochrome c oxidase subunit 2